MNLGFEWTFYKKYKKIFAILVNTYLLRALQVFFFSIYIIAKNIIKPINSYIVK